MRNPSFSATLVIILMSFFGTATQAKPQVDHPIVAAKAAFEASNLPKLVHAQRQLGQDPLRIWADYWVTRLSLTQEPFGAAALESLEQFMRTAGTHPLAAAIQRDWGHAAIRKGPWDQIASVIDRLPATLESPGIACAQARLKLERGQSAPADALLLVRGHESREGCLYLLEAIHRQAPLPLEALQLRARWAAATGDLPAARRIWLITPRGEAQFERERPLLQLLIRSQSNSVQVAQQLDRGQIRLREDQTPFAKGILAGRLFVRSDPKAWSFFQDAMLADAQLLQKMPTASLEAFARLSLRRGDWASLHRILEALPLAIQAEDHWRYWRGWLAQQRGDSALAKSLWQSIPTGWGFYQQLASAELDRAAPQTRRDSGIAIEIARAREQLQAQDTVHRALSLASLGLRTESATEWRSLLEQQADVFILAAAEIALASGHYDRAINAAIRTQKSHDLDLRYPKPYRKTIDHYSASRELEVGWVYGLIRQESRFLSGVFSPVGAAGLMQIMPRTAKSLAKEEGIRDFRPSAVTEPELNVRLGTRYLRSLYDQFNGSLVLATAAYNAGPARSRLWRATLVQPIPGAAFAESIPFAETRDYVKNVLANAAAYQAPGTPQKLLTWLGPISKQQQGLESQP
ncbi:MAG: transglycosylase SLT domain-containing protein [Burkholderiaceae bacterium]